MALSNVEIFLYNWLYALKASLENRHKHVIQNKWIIWVIVLLAVVGILGYAYYCTSKGYTFSGKLKFNWPKVWDIGIGCRP